jgi:hypothetical protein
VIKDTIYPCPEAGDLKWQPESERASQDAFDSLKEFLVAVNTGKKAEWLANFFSGKYPEVDMASAIVDIFSRYERREGRSVFRCPECERLYVQKEYRSDEYECFEKRKDYAR